MKKNILFMLSMSFLILTSINAITVINRDGSVYQTNDSKQNKINKSSNYLNPTSYYDSSGRKTGSAREIYTGTVEYEDANGKKIGSAREVYSGTVEYYDAQGRKTGSSRK